MSTNSHDFHTKFLVISFSATYGCLKIMSETGGSLNRPSKAMTARKGATNVEEGIPLEDISQPCDNVSQGQTEDENERKCFARISR